MKYALIKEGTVVNIILANQEFIDIIQEEYDFIIELSEEDIVNINQEYDSENEVFIEPEQQEPEVQPDPEYKWYIDIGPFTDRLGTKYFAVDTSTNPIVQSFNRDLGRRKWVDLKGAKVAAVLGYLAGEDTLGVGTIGSVILTEEEVNAILNTPVTSSENLALRKQYFNG